MRMALWSAVPLCKASCLLSVTFYEHFNGGLTGIVSGVFGAIAIGDGAKYD